ncbi:MAG TPA: TauD/TfdA family dioxygenase [Thermoanaerobaculia bacterium]
MKSAGGQKPSIAGISGIPQRKTVAVSQDLLRTSPLFSGGGLPLLATPVLEGVDLSAWMSDHRSLVERLLLEHGGILFRGFSLSTPEELERVARALAGDLLPYTYRSTPRSQVSGEVYTSTEYPASQHIPMHNEMSYTRTWPLKIWFLCVQTAETGGETPIADSREVYHRIDPDVRERFSRLGVLYARNYGEGLDLSWQSVFQTDDKAEVEAFCRDADIGFEWRGMDRLRTRQVCQAVATHPVTGEPVWFNQAHLFHVSSLEPAVREALLSEFGEHDLPRNAFYGDGAAIEPEVLDHIRSTYEEASVRFPWHRGDLLMLDNMMVAHGRTPFTGARKVLVAMAEAHSPARESAAGIAP